MKEGALNAIRQKSNNIIIYYPHFHRITGTAAAGVMLSQIMRIFAKTGLDRIYKSDKEIACETGLSAEMARSSKRLINDTQFVSVSKSLDTDVFRILNKKNSSKGCIFCGYDGVAIHQHHYPIRRKDGGTETISLCANCHFEFHHLTDYVTWYEINWAMSPISRDQIKRDYGEFL